MLKELEILIYQISQLTKSSGIEIKIKLPTNILISVGGELKEKASQLNNFITWQDLPQVTEETRFTKYHTPYGNALIEFIEVEQDTV